MTIKEKLADYQGFKKTNMELGRRDRIIKNAWRHGITGMDNADSANSSIFYKDLKARKDFQQSEKDTINGKRKQELGILFGTSSQLPISSPDCKRTRSLL
jgi:hypothetical protein